MGNCTRARVGGTLQEAKRVCKEDGTLFTAWCESAECPIGHVTAARLMSVYREIGNKNFHMEIFQHGFRVLSEVTMTRDEDIRQALLEHIQQKAEGGTLFTAWCESAECPVGVDTARRLMAVHRELGDKKAPGLFQQGFRVLAEVTQTRDEDIRQAIKNRPPPGVESLAAPEIPHVPHAEL